MFNEEALNLLQDKGILSPLDIHFARFATALAGNDDRALFLAAALVSNCIGQGHVCLDLSTAGGKPLIRGDNVDQTVVCPEPKAWKNKLEKSSVVGRPGQYRPLILDEKSRLYLYRYWEYENNLSGLLKKRVREHIQDMDIPLLKEGLERLFPEIASREIDWQKVAAFTALNKKFCVISGGPGTGKTTTIAKIIALILEQSGTKKARITLAAPTGKAASRLQEAMISVRNNLNCADQVKEAIPSEASTIHRLLGTIPDSPYFRHNAQNTLPVDTVVVDEASMIDMALMSKLVQALPQHARLVLLGDKNQLASVEAGAVLGDICDSGNTHGFSERLVWALKEVTGYTINIQPETKTEPVFQDCIVQLQKSYRFGSDSGIGAMSSSVNEGNGDASISLLKDEKYGDIRWKALPRPDKMPSLMRDTVREGFKDYLSADDPWKAFELFERFRILCALREGPYGVSALNILAEQILKDAGLADPAKTWYTGRPLLITHNDYNLRLFNGDVGIVMPDPEVNDDLRVFFPAADGTLRKLHPLRLPEHETVYAMTVHKSQGSEFDKVLMVLPDKDYPVLTRELIYTGITRARENIEIWGMEDVFGAAVSRRTVRSSGLRDALWAE